MLEHPYNQLNHLVHEKQQGGRKGSSAQQKILKMN
jgi:hypothetical protein